MEPPFIFISYSRKDETYVSKLIQALEDKGLTVWLDNRIDYGTTWPRVIEEHLEKCQVFILVMSSNSLNSHWVQCELNRALALKKPVFPILLEGTRWLAVETIQCVDVSNRELPPGRFFQQVSESFQVGHSRQIAQINQVTLIEAEDDLSSKKFGLHYYARLRDLLKAGDWKAADEETGDRMCEVRNRQKEGYLEKQHIWDFPCRDLRTIDRLWVKYSKGRFGFSVQVEIWKSYGSPTFNNEDWVKFGRAVGWRTQGFLGLGSRWLISSELTFNESAPKGHLPSKILASSLEVSGFSSSTEKYKEYKWLSSTPVRVNLGSFDTELPIESLVSFVNQPGNLMYYLAQRIEECKL